MKTHQEIDQRSLELHRLVVSKIRAAPSHFEKVKKTLKRFQKIVPPASQPYLQEWAELIDQGMEECLEVAIEDSARGRRLRQSSPFAGILTEKERLDFLKKWKEAHEKN